MCVNVRPFLALALVLAACGAPSQPTPTPTATPKPTAQATGTHGCGQELPTPTEAPSPGCTQTPSPAVSATPNATPTSTPAGTASGELRLAFKVYVDGFDALTFAGNAGDGTNRLFALEQVGRIRIIGADGAVVEQPFLDITDRIAAGGERGLLGLAFHPDYAANGRFYVDYTDLNGDTVVSEFTRTSDTTADPASERVIFTVDQPFANHNGGMVAFGPDGQLYVGMGDGGSGGDPNGNGQNDATLLGKLVRVDVDATGEAAEPQIWDKGLRNPWRFSFDRATGDLWIGDVGQGAQEEIDAEPAGSGGRNYGWNIMEGLACFATTNCDRTGLTLPVATYGHGGGDCTVVGGYVYRGSAMPSLVGEYLYADYCSGNVWALDAAAALAGEGPAPHRVGNVGRGVSSFVEDEAGELYLASQGGRIISISLAP
jgi:glucose/arabinose dehydrogenase